MKEYPNTEHERAFLAQGHRLIAGLDEAGRGAWAGPVVAAAVVLPLDNPDLLATLDGVRDSKLCTPRQRERLYDRICAAALAWAAAVVPASRIDEVGIVPATRQAMCECVAQLCPPPEALLIDALRLPAIPQPQRWLKKGDRHSLTIAAASIIAKVTRDREMAALEEAYPGYGLAQHKGYGTRHHRQALHDRGPARIHRFSFSPIAAALEVISRR